MASSPDSIDPPNASADENAGGANFEQTLARLEVIVHQLEDGKIGLDEALGRYEEGVGLLRTAYDMLQRADRKIALLTGLDAEGNPILRPMEDSASFSSEMNATVQGPVSSRRERSPVRGGRRSIEPDAP
jgi:exodeoxyribonuclease VII small subunit